MAHALKDRNETLEAEVQDLKTRLGALEERARTDLGMIREGEVFFQHAQASDDKS
jgi:cell division protein FtsB